MEEINFSFIYILKCIFVQYYKNFITEKHRPIELIGPELYDKLISKRNKMVSDKYKNEVMAKRVNTGEILKVTREEFNNNENLVGSTKGKGGEHLKRTISVLDEDGNSKRISIDSEEYKCGNYIGHTVGKTVYKDKHGNTCMCSVDDPRVLSGELVGINKGRKQSKESIEKYKLARVGLRPSAIKSIIFNEKDEPEFYSDGNFKEICARYDLPENLLYKTMKNNDTLDIISYFNNSKSNIKARIHKYLIYQGWYVRKVKYIKI